jgi:hypothetical protein
MQESKPLLFGPDSVWVNVCYGDRPIELEGDERRVLPDPRPLDAALFESLSAWQEQARKEERPVPTDYQYAGAPLVMYPNSGGLTSSWRFILRNHAIELKVGLGTRNGLIAKVRFSAEYLWQWRDLHALLLELHVYLSDLFFEAPVYLAVSEVHLCADVVGYDFAESEWQAGFIRRSAFTPHFEEYSFVEPSPSEEEEAGSDQDEGPGGKVITYLLGPERLHMRYRRITGFSFGSHKSAVSAVIYNKSNYIRYKAKTTTWFHALWQAAGWDGSSEVWRVEFRFKRSALHETGIDSAYELLDKLPGLWQYATQKWLRYAVPDTDSNRTRWRVYDCWLVVQQAYLQVLAPGQPDMGPVIRKQKRVVNTRQLVAQVVGCLLTFYAWRLRGQSCEDDIDISVVLHDFYPKALSYLEEREERERRQGKQWNFPQEVRYKQQLYSQVLAVA